MVEEKDKQEEKGKARQPVNPQIRLKENGAEMELAAAEGAWLGLTWLQEDYPKQFEALVAIVKPRGATRLPEKVSPKAVRALQKRSVLRADGSPDDRYAAVLDASYVETKEGAVLRDPVIYPNREFVEEREEHLARIIAERFEKERRKKRGNGEGPAR